MTKVKAQTPAYGVSENANWPNCKSYIVSCECTSSDHVVNTYIEIDSDTDIDQIEVTHWIETYTPPHNISRWKTIWTLLWKGYQTDQHSIMLTEQAARNWISAVEAAIDNLKEKKTNDKD